MVELKPCPFCGNTAIFRAIEPEKEDVSVGYKFRIECYACGATIPKTVGIAFLKLQPNGQPTVSNDKALEIAAKAWNRRADNV